MVFVLNQANYFPKEIGPGICQDIKRSKELLWSSVAPSWFCSQPPTPDSETQSPAVIAWGHQPVDSRAVAFTAPRPALLLASVQRLASCLAHRRPLVSVYGINRSTTIMPLTVYTALSQEFSGVKVDLHPTSMRHLSRAGPSAVGGRFH